LTREWENDGLVGFRVAGRDYAWNIHTTSCFEVDGLAKEILMRRGDGTTGAEGLDERYAAEEISEALAEIRMLEEAGVLHREPPADELPTTFGTMELHVSHACNLGCVYCFAEQGDYGVGRSMMSEEVALRAIDFFLEQLGPREHGSIVFFGGEPLMNLPVIKASVEHTDRRAAELGKRISYNMTTNGTLLSDEVIEYLNEHSISAMISIDGAPEIQDAQRPFKNGRGSYSDILPKVRKYSESRGGHLTARATVCHGAVRLNDTVRHLSEVGFDQVMCAPVSCGACSEHLSLDAADVETMSAEFAEGVREVIERFDGRLERSPLFSLFSPSMTAINEGRPRTHACGAGIGIVGVTPAGDFYPCHRFVGRDLWRMGSLDEGVDEKVRGLCRTFNVLNQPGCSACWLRHACGGSCLNDVARDDLTFGAPDPVLCALSRRLTESALALYVQIQSVASDAEAVAGE
jgi:uncharacterized protein